MATARQRYIDVHTQDVVNATEGSGLFPQVVLMQGAIESADGSSILAERYNNFYGIKATPDWKGDTIDMKTGEYIGGKRVTLTGTFRAYGSFLESTRDYVNFLKSNPRYTKGGVFTAKTPQEQANALQKSGYATAPSYAQVIIYSISANAKLLEKKIGEYISPTTGLLFLGAIALTIYGAYKYNKLKN